MRNPSWKIAVLAIPLALASGTFLSACDSGGGGGSKVANIKPGEHARRRRLGRRLLQPAVRQPAPRRDRRQHRGQVEDAPTARPGASSTAPSRATSSTSSGPSTRSACVGPQLDDQGQGLLRLQAPRRATTSTTRSSGEWGLDDHETGNSWDCVKQRHVKPDLKSIGGAARDRRPEQGLEVASIATRQYRQSRSSMEKQATRGIQFREPPIFERGAPGRSGASLAAARRARRRSRARASARSRARRAAGLPEVSEPEAFRHFVRLSQWNFCIDSQFYPLGSCTMKYNPKINEWAARLPGFARLHPLTPDELAQGALEIMCRLERMLCRDRRHGRRARCSPPPARRASSPGS